MQLIEFLHQTRLEIQTQVEERMMEPGTPFPFPESIFSEIVMQHMFDIGMTFEPQVCHYSAKMGNATLRLSGFSISEESDQLDLFVSLYGGYEEITAVSNSETQTAAGQCFRFLSKCVEGGLAKAMDESNDAYILAVTLQDIFPNLNQIRIYVLTDGQTKSKNFKPREVKGKTIKLEVMDIERLYRHWSEGKPRDELIVDFTEISGNALPCVFIQGENVDHDYALTAMPGETLRFVYEKYGDRLLEANVRSFLNVTGKVNKGIRDTLRSTPERFMAYNNGIVIIVDEACFCNTAIGGLGIQWIKGMQIVNGGQTTASIYFTKKKYPEVDLKNVRVPAKIIVLHSQNIENEEVLVSNISKYSNSQNAVRQSDLSANAPFHVELEKLALSIYCPDGQAKWFYERAAGSYTTMLAREGKTPALLKSLRTVVFPPSRRITKTDMAKYLNAWDRKPHIVSLGSQKNFSNFIDSYTNTDDESIRQLPDVQTYKNMIAKSIVFRKTQTIIRPKFASFQANITTYLISFLSEKYEDKIDFERIWNYQNISNELQKQLEIWAKEINEVLHRTAEGKMISEWAKKSACWDCVRSSTFSEPIDNIPEIRSGTY